MAVRRSFYQWPLILGFTIMASSLTVLFCVTNPIIKRDSDGNPQEGGIFRSQTETSHTVNVIVSRDVNATILGLVFILHVRSASGQIVMGNLIYGSCLLVWFGWIFRSTWRASDELR